MRELLMWAGFVLAGMIVTYFAIESVITVMKFILY